MSPGNKADLVSRIKKHYPDTTLLAIGDGANDVNMIAAAHIGVGIRGVEGYKASMNSDYSISQFQDLRKLILYHGRECYRRNTQLIFYNFYKNILLVMAQFWYGCLNKFSGQNLYENYSYQLYNIVFTSLPICIYALYDEEVPFTKIDENLHEDQLRKWKQTQVYQQQVQRSRAGKYFNINLLFKEFIIGAL